MATSNNAKETHSFMDRGDNAAQNTLFSTDGHEDGDVEKDYFEFEEDENMGVPTDKGYSWIIGMCSFFSGILYLTFIRSMSALFVDVSEEFSASTTVTSLTFTFIAMAISFSSLITSNIFIGRITVRTLCATSGFLNGMVTIAIACSPNIIVWLFLQVPKGIFLGAFLVGPTSMIGFYFKKKRALASAIGSMGFVVAYIVMPLLASVLRVEFGLRGALLILGALELHALPMAMLLRPIRSYRQAYLRKRERALLKATQAHSKGKQPIKNNPLFVRRIIAFSAQSDIPPRGRTHSENSLTDYLDYSHKNLTNADDENTGDPELGQNSRRRSASVTSKIGFEASIASSLLDVVSVQMATVNDVEDELDVENERNEGQEITKRDCSCGFSTFIDTSLLKLWTFRMIVVNYALSEFVIFSIIYIPVIAYLAGVEKPDAAFLLTMAGCMDLMVRLLSGYIADKRWISKENMIIGSLAVIVVLTQCARFYTTYSLLIMFAVLTGSFSGLRQNLLNAVLLDYFGAHKAAKALGIVYMLTILFVAMNHPVLGALTDATGSFTASLHYIGAMVFLSILILMTHPICKRWDMENKMKEAEEAAQDDGKGLTMGGK